MFLLKAFIAIHKFDIICLSETYLDSSTTSDDENLAISGYKLIRSDHPSSNKRGGVCISHKNLLSLRVFLIPYLQECINFELKIGGKTCNFIFSYRSRSQNCKILQNLTYILYILHLIYVRSGTTEKQTQDLLEASSKNLTGKEHF